jgi:hypothetical protein
LCNEQLNQKHLIFIQQRPPSSSHSDFLTHISSNEESDPTILPPIQTEYLLSAGA